MEHQINNFVAQQREMAAQMLSQYNSSEHQQQRDRDR